MSKYSLKKEYKSLLKEEYDWLDTKVIKDSNTKKEYKNRINEEVDKISELKMKEIQKTLKEMKLDKNSWKKMLGLDRMK